MEAAIFLHPALDFASIHIYAHGTIDDPRNTVDAAISMGAIVAESVAEISDGRPFFDSEHGPIHRFKDRHRTLPEAFDDEYFRHMQWAHLASGGAGGGMRWPNRSPHTLTPGMRIAQRGLARFLPLIDWPRFDRRIVSPEIVLHEARGVAGERKVARFGCASADQAVVYLVRRGPFARDGRLDPTRAPLDLRAQIPGLKPGRYEVTAWDTARGEALAQDVQVLTDDAVVRLPPLATDMAIALARTS